MKRLNESEKLNGRFQERFGDILSSRLFDQLQNQFDFDMKVGLHKTLFEQADNGLRQIIKWKIIDELAYHSFNENMYGA